MKITVPLFFLLAGSAQAFTGSLSSSNRFVLAALPRTRTTTTTSLQLSSSSTTSAAAPTFEQPPRVIRDELPTVYIYDHCPFCVRVRVALGIKNIKHNLYFMANDDIPTPTKLVGKKIAPIFTLPEDDLIMAESMDIVNLVENDERFGPTNIIQPATSRTDIKDWQKSVRDLLRTLQRPRYVATGLLPEFQQLDGRHAFIMNHQLPPYEKKDWKEGDMSMDQKLALYAEAMANDPAPLLEELNRKLVELDDIIFCDQYCSEGGISLDDVDLFSRLRSITIIKGVEWPKKLRTYMDNMSALADVPLYDEMAL